MRPLIESDLAVLAILLGLLGVCALVAWVIEWRAWYRGAQMYVDEAPEDDPRDKLAEFRRWQAQRKTTN
ncbi:MAG: hypothetical protein IT518_20095 [Burkholderiales bacterium]|nr:hypothetical protein [Burkholderiales bacterium]